MTDRRIDVAVAEAAQNMADWRTEKREGRGRQRASPEEAPDYPLVRLREQGVIDGAQEAKLTARALRESYGNPPSAPGTPPNHCPGISPTAELCSPENVLEEAARAGAAAIHGLRGVSRASRMAVRIFRAGLDGSTKRVGKLKPHTGLGPGQTARILRRAKLPTPVHFLRAGRLVRATALYLTDPTVPLRDSAPLAGLEQPTVSNDLMKRIGRRPTDLREDGTSPGELAVMLVAAW